MEVVAVSAQVLPQGIELRRGGVRTQPIEHLVHGDQVVVQLFMRLARHGALGEDLIELRLKLLLQDDAITRGGVKALHQGLHRLHPLGGLGVGRPGLAAVQLHHGRCPGLAVFGMFMPCVVGMIMRRKTADDKSELVELVGLYWHFVDVVWILIFTLVYLIPA